MFLRVGGICLRSTSVVRAMATARPSQQVLIRRDEGVAGSGEEVEIAEKAPNEANLRDDVFTAQHEETIDVPTNSAVFRDLTVVKRTQFFWRRSQFRRGVRGGGWSGRRGRRGAGGTGGTRRSGAR